MKQGKPPRNRRTRSPDQGTSFRPAGRNKLGDGRALHLPIPSAAWRPPACWLKAHGFASPPFGEFALSRMKGVVDPGQTRRPAPTLPPKLTTSFACSTLGRAGPVGNLADAINPETASSTEQTGIATCSVRLFWVRPHRLTRSQRRRRCVFNFAVASGSGLNHRFSRHAGGVS
jgi:hypothetical protein